MRWMMLLAGSFVVLLPGAAACTLTYDDPLGDANPPAGAYDLLGFEGVSGPESLWWRIQAASLDATTTSVQYLGQIDTGEREGGTDDGAAILYHPICPFDLGDAIDAATGAGTPRCHLSKSHLVGAAVSFELVGALEAQLEPGGWLNVTIPYALLGVLPNGTLRDLRSAAQFAVVTPGPDEEQPGTVTPFITDEQGSGQDVLVLCFAPKDDVTSDPESAPEGTVASPARNSTPSLGLLGLVGGLAAAAVARWRGRGP